MRFRLVAARANAIRPSQAASIGVALILYSFEIDREDQVVAVLALWRRTVADG